jgi:hypothetical protein
LTGRPTSRAARRTYFITDGYGGTRVVKYDANDNFIMDWGGPPKDPKNGTEQWNTVHSIAIVPTAGFRHRPRTCGCRSSTRTEVSRYVAAQITALAGESADADGESLHR